ncbi:MAG TPA: DUF2127 domain-containing protein [Nitrospira sp.]
MLPLIDGHSRQTGVALIAIFKAAKGLLLLLLGFGLLELVHADVAAILSRVIETLHLNGDSHLIHTLVLKVDAVQPHTVLVAALISLTYGLLLSVEGIGLWMKLAWAAYLTVISTSLLLPFEIYEVSARASFPRISLLVINIVIVWYLIAQLRRHTLRSSPSSFQPSP